MTVKVISLLNLCANTPVFCMLDLKCDRILTKLVFHSHTNVWLPATEHIWHHAPRTVSIISYLHKTSGKILKMIACFYTGSYSLKLYNWRCGRLHGFVFMQNILQRFSQCEVHHSMSFSYLLSLKTIWMIMLMCWVIPIH